MILGIDTGGTKCEAILCDNYGNKIAFERSICKTDKAGNSFFGYGRSDEAIIKVIVKILPFINNEKLYVSSVFPKEKLAVILDNLNVKYSKMFNISEPKTILSSANKSSGYVALAGTGAFASYFPESEDPNNYVCLDGLGQFLGDSGGGYDIGHSAIRATVKNEWNKKYHTSIAKRINLKYLGQVTNNFGVDLVNIFINTDKSDIASNAIIVNEEAEKGDFIALKILEVSAFKLAQTTLDLIELCNISEEKSLICGGSVIAKSKLYSDVYINAIKTKYPNQEIIVLDIPLVLGLINYVVKEIN